MIPTVIIVGLVLGRWWKVVVPVASLGWAVLLFVDGTVDGFAGTVGAAALALGNVAVGVLLNRGVAWAWRSSRPGVRQSQ